jgi:ABC-type antimicrobial peptide transport system permease subunit
MPFYEGDAWMVEGRDISHEEYKNGDKVCLVQKDFAVNNNLTVGGSLQLPLYIADYQTPPWYVGCWYYLNAKAEMYSVFQDSAYKIVGIYKTMTTSDFEVSDYEIPKNTVVIPSASVKNSDENNIVSMGPMKGYTTSFEIPNGQIDEYMVAWEKQGISTLEINFYDKGYTKIKAGLDDMMNTASVLLTAGGVITLLILILFCHLFITKQRKRTAIERSLGMTKSKCIASLLTGILVIVIPACVISSAISYWLTGYAAERVTAAHNEQAFDTTYSDWVNGDAEAEVFTVNMDNSISNVWAGAGVIPVALIIALVNIRGNLKSEPLRLLGEKER